MRSFCSGLRPLCGRTAVLFIQAYLSAFALCNIGGISPANILSFLLFGVMLLLFAQSQKLILSAARPRGFGPISALLAAFYMLCYMAAEHQSLTGGFDSRLFRFFCVLATAAGLFFLFRACCRALMVLFARICAPKAARPLARRQKLLLFAGLLLCWLPWFLYNYPGVMTPDSISQFSQATGLIPYSSHHPVLHTLLFQLFYQIGSGITGSVNAGIACYILFQMCVLSAVETGCLSLLSKEGAPGWCVICGFLFWGLVPYNGIFAVTMWKDVLFSAIVLLYALTLYKLMRAPDRSFGACKGLYLLLLLSGWLSCMLRSNGLYIFLFTLPFVLYAFRRSLKAIAAVQLAALALALLINGPVLDHFEVARPHFTESLSIPLQQVARVVSAGRSLTAEQEALINQVVDVSLIPEYYEPSISDPVKALVLYNNADYLEAHKGEFLKLWAELLAAYPRDYLEAFIDQTKGYWFPAPAQLRTNEGISPNEAGLAWPHLLRGQLPVKISEILLKMPDLFPVYGLLWSIGAFTWLLVFLMAFQYLYGKKSYLLLYLPFAATILTLLIATPVASDLRYAYPVLLGMPFLVSIATVLSSGRGQV